MVKREGEIESNEADNNEVNETKTPREREREREREGGKYQWD